MTHKVRLRVKCEPGALQRVLVFASKRGYEPVGIQVRRDGERFEMELKVESEKPKMLLVRTLGQLFDVESVLGMPDDNEEGVHEDAPKEVE